MKTRMRKLWLGAGALAVGTMIAAALAIPTGVFANNTAAPLVGGVAGLVAPAPVTVAQRANYTGYATVGAPYTMCTAVYPSTCKQVAWQWYPGWGWYQRSRADGTRVWVVPFGQGWSWTWTSSTGWLAMRSDKLIISYDTPPIIVT